MDVRAKQRLCYHVVLFPLACVVAVSPHVISAVISLLLKSETQNEKQTDIFNYPVYSLL